MTRACDKCGGTEFRGKRQECAHCAKVRNNARYAKLSADPQWVQARLARKRAWAAKRGAWRSTSRPLEERASQAIRRAAFRGMLVEWAKVARRADNKSRWWKRVGLQFAKRFGGRPEAATYRLRYHHDHEFRAKQVERLHKRNAMRDHAIEMASDGTLDGATIKGLFAAAKVCPHCPTIMGSRDKTLDHVVPISQGGAHSIANVMVICRACNTSKAGRTLEQWRRGDAFKRGDGQGLRPKVVESEASRARRIARGIAAQEENNRRMRSPEWREQCAQWRAEAQGKGQRNAA